MILSDLAVGPTPRCLFRVAILIVSFVSLRSILVGSFSGCRGFDTVMVEVEGTVDAMAKAWLRNHSIQVDPKKGALAARCGGKAYVAEARLSCVRTHFGRIHTLLAR